MGFVELARQGPYPAVGRPVPDSALYLAGCLGVGAPSFEFSTNVRPLV